MTFGPVILLLALASFGAWTQIILHAFRRSVGTGFLVLLVPCYVLYYAFSQFEHERKGVVVGVFVGCGAMAAMLYGAALSSLTSRMDFVG